MGLPQIYAQEFLSRFGLDCRVRLSEVAEKIGLAIEEVDADNFDGALLRVKGHHMGTIAINRNIRETGRKLFTLAHEIGHFVLPSQPNRSGPCGRKEIESWSKKLDDFELEANRFAGEILMPTQEIVPYLRVEPSFTSIREIARNCGTTLTAAGYRFVELSSFRVALVWSTAGRIVWYKASKEFDRGIPREQLDPQSCAFDSFRGKQTPDRFERVPASAWLYDVNLKEGATVLEHSISLPFYDSVLSLLHIRERIEKKSEYDDVEDLEEGLDPNEFTVFRKRWPRKG